MLVTVMVTLQTVLVNATVQLQRMIAVLVMQIVLMTAYRIVRVIGVEMLQQTAHIAPLRRPFIILHLQH